MKRSRALRGRNPTRDSQADGAPKVHPAFATSGGCFFSPSDTGAMPPKIRQHPSSDLGAIRFARSCPWFPFFYPSISRQAGIAQMGCYEMAKAAPPEHELQAQIVHELTFTSTG